ncbi:hypothetical protein BD94_3143 [Elizabethkingia anophelis NUHP1]|uniref:Uncharacterized protein n=1 Tax=Elizabethkingia anophelis NUHP1 TaxID=1338011 RepID=A0A077EK56_9FLAO|nr:hypothetical protein BD94_3143 [Elizabethkingia anophelis NUHP1]
MKKISGIILIIIGFCITVLVKVGPSEETKWVLFMATYHQ